MNPSSRKMEGNVTGMWVSFFTTAGIPSDVSATYALTFTENRIQDDMLLDLNKEYLRDMGITRMGDVIAILRHAKQVHENAARDRVLNTASSNVKVPVAAVAGRLTNTTVTLNKPASPASRILEHYTRNAPVPEAPVKVAVNTVQLKRKMIDSSTEAMNIKKSRFIRFGTSQNTVKEGPALPKPTSKTTVFSRLGNNEPKKTITLSTQPTAVEKQIFSRLGAKTAEPNNDKPVPIEKDALKYEGILKGLSKTAMTVTATKNNRKIAVATMRADETPQSIKQKLALPVTVKNAEEKVAPKTKSVKFSNTVQYKEIEPIKPAAHIFNNPERRLSMTEAQDSVGIKARLGVKTVQNNLNVTKNTIFKRLGV